MLRADALSSGLSLVVQGQVAVYTARRREERPLVVLTPGRTFGQATPALSPANATLKALTHCEIWFLEPAPAQSTPAARQSEAKKAALGRKWGRAGLALLIVLAAALLLAVPSGRAALVALPMSLGDWCHQQGKAWCARQAWTAAGLMAPDDTSPTLALGTLAFREGDLDAAERAFEQARAADPGTPEAYNNLGVVYYRRGEYEKAAIAFEQTLVLEPGSASAERNLGDTFLALQAYDEAIGHYQVALSLGEPSAGTLANLAVALYEAGQPAGAEKALEQALARAGDKETRDQIGRNLTALQAATDTVDNP